MLFSVGITVGIMFCSLRGLLGMNLRYLRYSVLHRFCHNIGCLSSNAPSCL